MIRKYDIIDPSTQGELEKRLKALRFGSAILYLVVRESAMSDELAIRRPEQQEVHFEFVVDSVHGINGSSPYVLGNIDDDDASSARIEVTDTEDVEESVEADNRSLHLSTATS